MHKSEISYGIIPLRHVKGEWELLLVQHGKGHWAFPKGHADPGEEPIDTAARELQEETGLTVHQFLETDPLEEKYMFRWKGDFIHKKVVYFVAKVSGKVVIQAEEIGDFKWVAISEGEKLATFPATKKLCAQVQDILAKV